MKVAFDPSLYLILDLTLVQPHMVEELAVSAIAGGVTLIQLRGKGQSTRALCSAGERLRGVLAPRGIPLIVNDDVAVAAAIGADGVHLGQDDLSVTAARRLLGKDTVIGLSVGTPAEAVGVDAALIDYVSIGPVFATATKGDAGPAIGTDGFRLVRRLFPDLPAVAIGGITRENAARIVRAGAAGLAVASSLCRAADPAEVARDLRQRITTASAGAA